MSLHIVKGPPFPFYHANIERASIPRATIPHTTIARLSLPVAQADFVSRASSTSNGNPG